MWNHRFVLLCVILLGVGAVTSPIELLFPVYVEDALGKSVWFAATLRAIQIGLGGLFALLGGALSDRFGRKLTLIIGMTGALVLGGVFTTQQTLLILGCLCYQGVTFGIKTAGGQSYLIGSVDSAHLGLASAIYFLSMTFGGAVGSAIFGELIPRLGYSTVGIGAILLMILLVIAAIARLPSLPKSTTENRRESFAQTLAGYRKLIQRREMRLLLGIRFLPTYYWGTVSLLLPVLINRTAGVKLAGYYGTWSLLFASCCQLLTGRICDAVGTRIPALVTNCLITLSAGLMALYTDSTVFLYAAGILGAGAAWSLSITMPRFIDEFSRPEEKGRGVGITHLAWSAGFLSGQVVSGGLERINVSLPFAVSCVLVAISVGLAFTLWLSQGMKRET